MSMPAKALDWTVDMLDAIPADGNRYEIVDGELFVTPSPSPPHQRGGFRLAVLLDAYLRAEPRVAEVLMAPLDARVTNRTSVEPDVLVIPRPVTERPDRTIELSHLLLAVEVISPSSARADRMVKQLLYQRAGVEYWIVDLDAEIVERWLPSDERPEILRDHITWQPWPGKPPLLVSLPELFAEARPGAGT